MRKLTWIVVLLGLAYSGYWFVASASLERGLVTALDTLKADGRADYRTLTVQGFPSRLDATIEAPALSSPDGFTRWAAPFLQVFALSYRPNHVIAVFPPEQTVGIGYETLGITTADMRASAVFEPGLDLPLDHATLIAKAGKVVSDLGWTVSFDELRLASRQNGGSTAHDLGLALSGLAISGFGTMPGIADADTASADVDATVAFDRPVDRNATALRPTGATIRKARLASGNRVLDLTGEIAITETGLAEGKLSLVVQNWREVLDLLVSVGIVRAELAPTWAMMIERLDTGTADADTVELPVTVTAGRISLGPLPIGAVPGLAGYLQ